MIDVRVQAQDFDVAAELARLEALGGGAVASFIGVVRGGEGLTEMALEQYPGMTQEALRAMTAAAVARWRLDGAILVHRFGTLAAGARIVLVATAARHRQAALEACASLIDQAKMAAPFWKQERFADGTARWVEPRSGDLEAAARW